MSETIEKPVAAIEDDATKTLMEHQLLLEKTFSKNQLIPRMKAEFQAGGANEFLIENEIPIPFGLDLLVQMALHKRANLPTLVGLLYHHFNDAQATVDMILKAAQADLMDWSPNLELFIVRFQISPETQEELDRFMYPLPMVVEPKPIRTNKDTGYFLGSGSVILKNNHHGDDVCLDHLNRVNRIKLTINMAVVKMVHNKWKNLERIKPGETREEFAARKKAFVKYDRVARDVVEFLMQESDHFYLTHKYDKRGRVYSQGYHVSDQGNDWNKAVIEFANREVIDG